MNQGTRSWYLCYHSTKLPVTKFVHLDDNLYESASDSMQCPISMEEQPNANSTRLESRVHNETNPCTQQSSVIQSVRISTPGDTPPGCAIPPSGCAEGACTSHDVGHVSHIPRTPPTQATFTIPSVVDKSMLTIYDREEDLFGMIKLRDNDVCYTSGTIEWIGRKRSYPINSGFKLMTDNGDFDQSRLKKLRKVNKTFSEVDKMKECDCADVLPTVNAIVDHLNALHEAVDLVDLRLTSLEKVMSRNDN